MTGAKRDGQTSIERVCISSLFSELRSTIIRPTGDIIAAMPPCSSRHAMKPAKPAASPQAIEAAVKSAIAAQKRLRVPRRSASQPLAGMHTAAASA